jgi:hypothetical protein
VVPIEIPGDIDTLSPAAKMDAGIGINSTIGIDLFKAYQHT